MKFSHTYKTRKKALAAIKAQQIIPSCWNCGKVIGGSETCNWCFSRN